MVIAARTVSQVVTHMGIAFGIMYFLTGSVAFGGLAALLEPMINVVLLPLHERAWAKVRAGQPSERRVTFRATEKLSQAGMHMGVAFAVMYWATGSAAFGGLAVVLEPACNMLLLPYHDRAWERFAQRLETRRGMQPTPA